LGRVYQSPIKRIVWVPGDSGYADELGSRVQASELVTEGDLT
jgi:hypothetical protein